MFLPSSPPNNAKTKVTGTTGPGNKYGMDVASTTIPSAIRQDEASSTVTYIGRAAIGTANSAASWQIFRITISGTVTSTEWADSNANYDNVWNNRASLTYG